ncbi:alpha/beta hydrolase [Nocardiopsis salina]|uniref:alpha/beta hydrolase n=1 Tax=Nocardiopsis salina TaxID=245836 RepID=UPI0003497ADF|nr:alpha/beta hydrolase [Nocardiopsis salina]
MNTDGTVREPGGASVRDITLDADGVELSGLIARPAGWENAVPPAVIVALHGRSMRAGYFHGQAHPDVSLLDLASCLGHTVLALDRPGYGRSAGNLPEGQTLAEQSATLHAALRAFSRDNDTGAGYFVVAHSYGGKVALQLAADDTGGALIGLDISGCGMEYSADGRNPPGTVHGSARLNWGDLQLYPPGTFKHSRGLLSPVPAREESEWPSWPRRYQGVAAQVETSVRLTFAEHEAWWRVDDAAIGAMVGHLSASPAVGVHRQPGAGHNLSLGWAARSYHLRVLEFLAECLPVRSDRPSDGCS